MTLPAQQRKKCVSSLYQNEWL